MGFWLTSRRSTTIVVFIGAKEKGSSNAIGFANKQIDQIIDSLNYEYDRATRIDLYHKFHKIIHELAPYTFLYTQK